MNKQKNPAVTSRIKSFSKAGHSARQTLNIIRRLIKLRKSTLIVKLSTFNVHILLCALRRV